MRIEPPDQAIGKAPTTSGAGGARGSAEMPLGTTGFWSHADRVIGHDAIDQVRSRTNLIELVAETVNLKRRGRSHIGLCPFHQEKTPSFNVNEERGFYHCFGCGKSGDAIRFVEETEGLSFVEAVRRLAERAGVTLVETRDAHSDQAGIERARRREQGLFELLQVAAAFYERCLREHPGRGPAQAELVRRGLHPDDQAARQALEAFRVGYAPDGWDGLSRHLRGLGLSLTDAEALGLLVPRKQGPGHYDRFRHRLMFAVVDLKGRVVAFSGRALPSEEAPNASSAANAAESAPAKYINSPESAVYRKRDVVFGLYQARPAIRKEQNCIVVEGNFDVVSLHARGVSHAVAPLGTAFTLEQARQIRRFTPAVTLLFDADAAGRRAVHAAKDPCRAAELRASVASLPAGSDPDEVVRSRGPEAIRRSVESAQGMLEFLINSALDASFTGHDLASRAERIREVTKLLQAETDPAVRALARQHADRIAERLGITDAQTFQALARTVRHALSTPAGPSDRRPIRPAPPARDRRHEIGRAIFGALLDSPAFLLDEEVVHALGVLEGDVAAAVAGLRRDPALERLDDFLELLPSNLRDFARRRLAAPLDVDQGAARNKLFENLRKLRALELSRRQDEALRELERVERTGDFDHELRLLEEQAHRARERLGL